MSLGKDPTDGRSSLQMQVDSGNWFNIGNLIKGTDEHIHLDLFAWTGRNIKLKVEGANSVHVLGYYEVDDEDENQKKAAYGRPASAENK